MASMDAGGLAHMTYNNNFPASNALGVPGSGFASRGKGVNIKRLNTNAASKAVDNGAPTPRTSRSHLLAGLRTAPKSATAGTFPQSASAAQVQHTRTGLENSIYADGNMAHRGAKTATASGFSLIDENRQMFSHPEQVLAPPEIHIDEHGQEQMDPNLYNQLVATNAYLAEQQQILQQQLINAQAAAQQFKLNLGGGSWQQQYLQQQIATPPYTPNMYQQQQMQAAMQPIVTAITGQPGVYAVYNPMTGEQGYFMDQNAQNQYVEAASSYYDSPPQSYGTPRVQVSPPPPSNVAPAYPRSSSPPKKSNSPPQDVSPLPPPSANAFRRGHKKSGSLANSMNSLPLNEGLRSTQQKSAGFPATPMTGTFGPGQNRAGEHPVRQPRGPPPLDELISKPTTKHEGSKNFATRQRRDAVKNLSRSLMERRRVPGSAGSMTPVSEAGEISFSISSDNDSDSGRSGSGSLSGRPTTGSSRTSFHGAIGSDRPSSRQKQRERSAERVSTDSHYTTASISSDDETANGGSFAAVFKNGGKKTPVSREIQPRKAPMLILTSAAEKRKSVY